MGQEFAYWKDPGWIFKKSDLSWKHLKCVAFNRSVKVAFLHLYLETEETTEAVYKTGPNALNIL